MTYSDHVPLPGKHDDMPQVEVSRGGVEAAIRSLNKKMGKSGIFRALKERKMNPAPAARAKAKAKAANTRRLRDAARRAKR
jgi:ribosomal protein S21